MKPTYKLEKRGQFTAVVRIGIKGGLRTVAVYPYSHAAESVCHELNRWSNAER